MDLKEKAKKIPLKKLRKAAPKIKSKYKSVFIDYLSENDKILLEKLAFRYTDLKSSSLFLYRYKKDFSIDTLSEKIKNECNDKKYCNKDDDVISEFKEIIADQNEDVSYVTIVMHTQTKKLHAEDAVTLKVLEIMYREGYPVSYVIHHSDKIIECKTPSFFGADTGLKNISKLIYNNDSEFEVVKIPIEKQKKIDENLRSKLIIISNLNYAGANKIIIHGEDVDQTIDVFKDNKIDFTSMDGVKIDRPKSMTSNNKIRFTDNGKISINKSIENYYDLLKSVI